MGCLHFNNYLRNFRISDKFRIELAWYHGGYGSDAFCFLRILQVWRASYVRNATMHSPLERHSHTGKTSVTVLNLKPSIVVLKKKKPIMSADS